MTLKEFKQALIDYGRTCIPEELRDTIRIPGTSENDYLYLRNTNAEEVLALVKKEFDKDSISTQIAKNTDLPDLQELESFAINKDKNDQEVSALFQDREELVFLEEEKAKVKHNVDLAIHSKNTSINQLLMAAKVISSNGSKLDIPLFLKEDLEAMTKAVNKTKYDGETDAAKLFYRYRDKLEELASQVFQSIERNDLGLVRKERINKQAGQGATFQNWKEYVLVGYNAYPEQLNKTLFLKFAIHNLKSHPMLTVEVDVDRTSTNYAAPIPLRNYVDTEKDNNRYHELLDYDRSLAEYAIHLDESVKKTIKYLDQCTNYFLSSTKSENNNVMQIVSEYSNWLRPEWNRNLSDKNFDAYVDNFSSCVNSGEYVMGRLNSYEANELKKLYHSINEEKSSIFGVGSMLRFIESKMDSQNTTLKAPNNQILYGPPGTGKTYNTINKAIEICDPGFNLNQSREIIKERFDRLQKEGQIVFTTFHQSLGYEDFIEGLKPKEVKGSITYPTVDGLFKETCKEAFFSMLSPGGVSNANADTKSLDSIYEDFLESIKPEVGTGQPVFHTMYKHELILLEIKKTSIIVRFKWYNKQEGVEATQPFSVTKEKLFQLYEGGLNPDEITNMKESFKPFFSHNLSVYYAVYKSFYKYMKENSKEEMDLEPVDKDQYAFEELLDSWDSAMKENNEDLDVTLKKSKKYVMIIDEINRGNISQIFGELITLIESGKRAGREEALTVTLPYSRDKFAIPPNLYLIGTMNTADRSVEALDVALRRRFAFEHMPPNLDLLSPARMVWELWWKHENEDWKGSNYEVKEKAFYELLKAIDDKNTEVLAQLDEEKEAIWDTWEKQSQNENQIEDLEKFELIGLDRLLSKINERIAYLKDDDHQIGHSYFLGCFTATELEETFNKNIIPLLKEYFYNDYAKIRMILGDGFVEFKQDWKPDFASDEDVLESNVYRVRPMEEVDILDAIALTSGKSAEK